MNVTLKKALLAVCASIGLGLAAAPANAVPITPSPTLTLGSLTFNNFSCNITAQVGFTQPGTCGQIDVSAQSSVSGLQIQSNFLAGGPLVSGVDVALGYTVTSSAGLINAIDLSFNGSVTPSMFGYAVDSVIETVKTADGTIVGNLTVSCNTTTGCDLQDPPYEIGDIPLTGSYGTLYVTKDISLGTFLGASAQFSIIDQSFHVPEPMTLALLGSALVGLGAVRRKAR